MTITTHKNEDDDIAEILLKLLNSNQVCPVFIKEQ